MITSVSSSTNVTFITTLYAAILLFWTCTSCSLTHALRISRRVLEARLIPCATASSRL